MIAIGSDNLITLTGLYDLVSASYVNSATVNAVLANSQGNSIVTVSLSYVVSSNGNYQGTLAASNTSGLSVGGLYYLTVTATDSGITFVDQQAHVANYNNS